MLSRTSVTLCLATKTILESKCRAFLWCFWYMGFCFKKMRSSFELLYLYLFSMGNSAKSYLWSISKILMSLTTRSTYCSTPILPFSLNHLKECLLLLTSICVSSLIYAFNDDGTSIATHSATFFETLFFFGRLRILLQHHCLVVFKAFARSLSRPSTRCILIALVQMLVLILSSAPSVLLFYSRVREHAAVKS